MVASDELDVFVRVDRRHKLIVNEEAGVYGDGFVRARNCNRCDLRHVSQMQMVKGRRCTKHAVGETRCLIRQSI